MRDPDDVDDLDAERQLDRAEDYYLHHIIGEDRRWPVWSQSTREQWALDHGEEAWDEEES